jgi:hypothetical protein
LPREAKGFEKKFFPFLFNFVCHYSQRRAGVV